MNKDKISSQEIIDSIASQLKINKRSAETFLKAMFGVIEEALLSGESVKVKNFGTFKLQWNEARESVNVTTGEKILLEGYNKINFIPDAKLKEIVNEPFAFLEPIQLDDETTKIESLKSEDTFDPLNILSDQASEIKELLLEINGLSGINSEEIAKQPVEITTEEPEEISEVDEVSEQSAGVEEMIEQDKPETFENESFEVPVYSAGDSTDSDISETSDNPTGISQESPAEETVIESQSASSNNEAVPTVPINQPSDNQNDIAVQEEQQVVNDTANQIETEIEDEPYREIETSLLAQNKTVQGQQEEEEEEENKGTSASQPETKDKFVIPPTILSTPDAFSLPVKPANVHRKGCLITLLVIFLLVGGFIVNYYLSSATRCWIKYTLLSEENTAKLNKFDKKVTTWMQNIEDWVSGIIEKKENKSIIYLTPDSSMLQPDTIPLKDIPADTLTDTANIVSQSDIEKIKTPNEADSIKILFDGPRVYPKTIALEKMKEGNRLTLLAERYYGLKDFWVYIYEANKDRISNPDNIANGTEIRIPKVDKRLINKDNPECIKKAKELHDLYVGKKN